jgi:adenylate cyclase
MAEEGFKRKLAAILSADVEGYSRLMDDDEEATVRTLTSYRTVIADLIQQFRGRVVDTPGDNILAEFSSVVDAVNCAVEIQRDFAERNTELPYNRKMEFRIGVNLGDVIEEEGRIYGDGVNIAARVESLSEAGGICISGRVYDLVENKLDFEYEFLGEQKVKNISRPVRVYRVQIESNVAVSEVSRTLELPDKPSIAVLAFTNMSGDPEQEYFSDGITEEIITALSKVPHMFVIARTSSFKYKGKAVDVQQIGRQLGVRYVLEGSVRKAGNRVRITAQLVDATTGHHLWAERYDRDLKEIFALQDEITKKIITALQVTLTQGEQASIMAKGTDNLEVYLKLLQGFKHLGRLNRQDVAVARKRAEEIIALEPNYAMGYWLLAKVNHAEVWLGSSKFPKESLARTIELAQKALSLDDSLADAHSILGQIYLMQRQYEKSIAEGEQAIALAPNSAEAYAYLGFSLNFAGEHKKAIPIVEKAIRLNPFPRSLYFQYLGIVHRDVGNYEESMVACRKATYLEPNNIFARLCVTAAYSLLGCEEEACAEATEVLRIDPKFSLEYFSKKLPYKNKTDRERLINALRKAGLK